MSDKTCFKCGQPIEGGIPIAFHPGDGWAHPISMECDTRPANVAMPCGCWITFRYTDTGEREMRVSPCDLTCPQSDRRTRDG